MKPWGLAAAAVLMSGAAWGQAATSGLSNYAPIPKAEPLTETVHGVTVSDPYRWMEKPERRQEMVDWIKASSAHTRAELEALPGRAPLLKALQDASRANTNVGGLKVAGNTMFYTRLAPDANVPVLMVRQGGRNRLFLDPAAGREGKPPRALNYFDPSPDGKLVAINMAEGGAEVGTTRFYDVATGQPLPDALTPIWGEFDVDWIDDRTIVYTRMNNASVGNDAMQDMLAYTHRLGTPTSQDVPVFGKRYPSAFTMTAVEFPIVYTRPASRWAVARSANARADGRFATAPLADLVAGKPKWAPLIDYADKVRDADFAGDTLYILTMAHDPNGEVRALTMGRGGLSASTPVMASSGLVLTGINPVAGGVYVRAMAPDASTRLFWVARGAKPVEIRLPIVGSGYAFEPTADGRALTFGLDGITEASTFYRLDGARLTRTGLANVTLPAASNLQVIQEEATSADGTKVPLTITAPKGPVRPLPAILNTYASYGASGEPYYSSQTVVWVNRGGVTAECHARGGGEKGRAWHEGGRSANKPNAMADVIACGERLVQLGWTTPKLMGLFSASAGGLLVTPVGLKRPDLFAGVGTAVGIVNATRLGVANNGPNQFAEMGDPNTDDGFRALASQDSTLLLAGAQGGTDNYFTIGLNDHRVDPWMSAKLVAMMRTKWGDRHLALIHSDVDAGHGIGSTRDQRLIEITDMWTFMLNRFGQPGFVAEARRAAK